MKTKPSSISAFINPRVALLLLVSLGLGGLSPVLAQSNQPPVADAGADQTVNVLETVTLDGSQSYDPDGDAITYMWIQTAGPSVSLSSLTSAHPFFTAPPVDPNVQETLRFELVVTDSFGASSAPDTVVVTVQNPYPPPDCSSAQPSIATLWSPNHKFQRVSIVGVRDSHHEITLTTAVTGISQDEPVTGTGDSTAPDAVIQPDGSVLLRAERADSGNGRVYHVFFTADDGFGGLCAGAVTVCVPITRNGSCIDEGPLYGSTRQ